MLSVRKILVLLAFSIADETQTNECLECTTVLSSYTQLINDYQSCVRISGQQTGQLAVYEGLLTNGLQSQINAIKQDQITSITKITAEAAAQKMLRENALIQTDQQIKLNDEKIEKVSSNQHAVMLQQTNIRNVQSAVQEEIKNIITTSQLNDLIDAKCQAIVETKMKSADVVSIEKFNQLEKQLDSMDKVQPSVYFTATANSHFTTDDQFIPFPNIVSDSNSGFDGGSGVLTVKVSGVYNFLVIIMKFHNQPIHFGLMHNDTRICRAHSNDPSKYQMLSCTATISVKSGDTISVQLQSGQIHAWSTFTGFRIGNN